MMPTLLVMPLLVATVIGCTSRAQDPGVEPEVLVLHHPISKSETEVYRRLFRRLPNSGLIAVTDYNSAGQKVLEATYSSFHKEIKEAYWTNHGKNVKEGQLRTWYANGQLQYTGRFVGGLREGRHESFFENGSREAVKTFSRGRLHGESTWWNEDGSIQRVIMFEAGLNVSPRKVRYDYLLLPPDGYDDHQSRRWPLLIYLHGGSGRGDDLSKLYSGGIPHEIARGRSFPFIVAAPQCPENLRWSTDDWFESFLEEILSEHRVDQSRIYLTGPSLGGSGTWYLAIRYPDLFAAIAPMCGFTHHIDLIKESVSRLASVPIWAFHGKADLIVPFEDTEILVDRLTRLGADVRLTTAEDAGHEIMWSAYQGEELYRWFLEHERPRAEPGPGDHGDRGRLPQ